MKINLPPLHPAQLEIARSGARFRVVSAGRRFGKGVLGVGECFKRGLSGAKCRWVAPSYSSDSFQAGWNLAATFAAQIPNVPPPNHNRKQFDFSAYGGGWLQFRTAEEPDALRGEGIDFVVFDEAAHIPNLETTWEQCVRPSLMDRKGDAWFISTPRGFNYFHTLALRGRDDPQWAFFQHPTSANPTIDPSEIEAMRASLPALVARQEIDAEFVQLAGALFKRENVQLIDAEPACRYVRSWDLAFTQKTTSDYTAGARVGLDADGRLIVAHMVHLRAEWPTVVRTIAETARLDGSVVQQGIECVGAQVGALQTLLRDPLLVNHTFRPITVDKDKLTRALPLIARSEQGKLAVVKGPWTQAFLDELCAFDGSGKGHDDQVDAVTGAMQLLTAVDYFVAVV